MEANPSNLQAIRTHVDGGRGKKDTVEGSRCDPKCEAEDGEWIKLGTTVLVLSKINVRL